MYNAEIKQKFLDEKIERNASLGGLGVRAFKQIEKYEEELGKDCCCFTINEIIIYYQRKCSTSLESLNTLNTIYRGYTNWCLSHNMIEDNQNHYNEINQDILNYCLNYGMVNDKIISRNDLLFVIKDFINVSDKALMLAIFEGICGTNMCELLNLKCEDIIKTDEKYIVKLCTGRELEISKELYNYCVESQECYYHYAHNVKSKDLYKRPYSPEDKGVFKILLVANTTTINRKSLYNKMIKAKKEMSLNYLTTHTLQESGRIEMIKKIMDETGKTLDEVLTQKLTEDRYGTMSSYTNWKRKYAHYIEG